MLYLVRKPLGITSNLVVKILKRVLDVNKIGFAGTLDPLASGLMIVGTYGSPRLFPMIEHFRKTYTTTIRLDGTTESFDLEKLVIEIPVGAEKRAAITLKKLEDVIQQHFLGDILQSPPLYSAIWIDGTRSYERMRNGEKDLEIPAKPRTIHEFEILSYAWPRIECKITVSHGTYIRSIARDMGELLGTGGYLEKLERISLGHILLDTPREWVQHNDIFYTPLSHAALFPDIPLIELLDEQKIHLRTGSTPISYEGKNGKYFVKYDDDTYGLLEAKDKMIYPLKNCV